MIAGSGFGVVGVGGGLVGFTAAEAGGVVAPPPPGPLSTGSPRHQLRGEPMRTGSARSRSSSPRGRVDTFSRPPRGALPLSSTPASDRPVGLLGSVLRREAAIAAMKTAVQVSPQPPGRERSKALRELAETLHEFRESTVDAVELLAARPKDAARFYWNGMDLVLKMLTDLQWAPVPQTADPLLWKWFSHWSGVWSGEKAHRDHCNPDAFAVSPTEEAAFLTRCRMAEKKLLFLARGASTEGAGMGGWATQELNGRVVTLHRVQTHRLTAAHSEGGANHAQKRRFANMEVLLYGKEAVHLKHLHALTHLTSGAVIRAANSIKRAYRVFKAGKNAARRAREGHAAFLARISPDAAAYLSTEPPMPDSPPALSAAPPNEPFEVPSPGDALSLDRSYLREISHDLPDLA